MGSDIKDGFCHVVKCSICYRLNAFVGFSAINQILVGQTLINHPVNRDIDEDHVPTLAMLPQRPVLQAVLEKAMICFEFICKDYCADFAVLVTHTNYCTVANRAVTREKFLVRFFLLSLPAIYIS